MNRAFIVAGLACLLVAIILLQFATYWMHKEIADRERAMIEKALSANRDLSVEIRALSNVNKELIQKNRDLLQQHLMDEKDTAEQVRLLRWRLDRCVEAADRRRP